MPNAETTQRLYQILVQARSVIDSIEGARPAGGSLLWVALWDLRELLLDIDDPKWDLPRLGGSS